MLHIVFAVTIAMTAVMLVAWFTQRAMNNGGWTDVFWTFGTGLFCALAALFAGGGETWRHLLVAGMILVWAIRLGSYVALRVAGSREDVRYAFMRAQFGRRLQPMMFGLLIVQGPVTGVLSIAVTYAARQPVPQFRAADLIGVLIMLLAIGGEGLADRQMKQFKKAGHGHDAVCDQGLWAVSRHPNYLFEWLGWFAYPVIAISLHDPWSWLSLTAPLMMYLVLRFATGVPPLEAAMVRSKGEAYVRYQKEVGAMLPRLRS